MFALVGNTHVNTCWDLQLIRKRRRVHILRGPKFAWHLKISGNWCRSEEFVYVVIGLHPLLLNAGNNFCIQEMCGLSAYIDDVRNLCKIVVGKYEGKMHQGKLGLVKSFSKWILKKLDVNMDTGLYWSRISYFSGGILLCGNRYSGSLKAGN